MSIIDECRKAMYNAIWMEIDRDPQEPSFARVDVRVDSGTVEIYCDRHGNCAIVNHDGNDHDSEALEERIESCVSYQEVFDDYMRENPDAVTQEDLASDWKDSMLDYMAGF